MPRTVKILLESILRNMDGRMVTEKHLNAILQWKNNRESEIPFNPARILMQDFTGVPALVDLAAMRNALKEMGGNPEKINPLIPVDLVIDHSVQVDRYGSASSLSHNTEREFQRNNERYEFLRWASEAFDNFSVIPPSAGICHQVNLEHLAKIVLIKESEDGPVALPDTLLGTDSHTTMINGLGVLGWGVGGIEAEAAVLGQPVYVPVPEVIGFRIKGFLPAGVTSTDLVLTVTQILREYGVVGRFVEFFGPGVNNLDLPDRATISNMCPEYGATAALFPVDEITLEYMRKTGRSPQHIETVESYTRTQGLFGDPDLPDPEFSETLELDIGQVLPSIAGPNRPQDRIALSDAGNSYRNHIERICPGNGRQKETGIPIRLGYQTVNLTHGSVVIAAITSCTNTSNPSVMVGAGLLARKAVESGLKVSPHVKTSLAPGSRVVSRYLKLSGLMPYLEALGFHLVGFGCATCIGNSGALHPEIEKAILDNGLEAVSVISGNRNFEGRIHPLVKASYLASPLLVVAYAIAGTMTRDLTREPLGCDPNGQEVYLDDIWPTGEEIKNTVEKCVTPQIFKEEYGNIYSGNESWNRIKFDGGKLYSWTLSSTYIRRPLFLENLPAEPSPPGLIGAARILAVLGDSVTTDHISPAGTISPGTPAAEWLLSNGVEQKDFNSYGSRRGNHEVMIRGTFANLRVRNLLVPEKEGGFTLHLPDGKEMTIFEAGQAYAREGVPLIVLAGKDYGMGSSRDWAAKGTTLLGVQAVIAESFERIHRNNLVGMGVLPLQFKAGESASSLGLTGKEEYDIEPVTEPRQVLRVTVRLEKIKEFSVTARIDSAAELEYYRNGGILPAVLRRMV
jgi:aconitate hydratase